MRFDPLFSVIVLHYNQESYIKYALDSIFIQDYSNIELIIADDGSKEIHLESLRNYVDEKRRQNIRNVIWQINGKNLGTIQSINRAVSKANGKYLLFFAADDVLCNERVVSNFADALNSSEKDVYMVSGQCHMMDEHLEKELGVFVNPSFAYEFNNYVAVEQYKVFAKNCFLAIGATAMKTEMFDRFGKFNEEYKLVEDWSYFLHLTRNGGRVQYHNFDALLHRDGGVSHFNGTNFVPRYVLDYKYDIVRIFEKEVLDQFQSFSYLEQLELYNIYLMYKNDYLNANGERPIYSYYKLLRLAPGFACKKALGFLMEKFDSWKWKIGRAALKTTVFWASLSIALFFIHQEIGDQLLTSEILRRVIEAFTFGILPVICTLLVICFISMLVLTYLNKFRLFIKKMKRRRMKQGE